MRGLIAQRLGSRWCCAWQVGLALVLVGLVFSAVWTLRLGYAEFLRVTAYELIADAVAAVALWIASTTVFRTRANRHQSVLLVAVVWVAISIIRGMVMLALQPDDLTRVLNSNVTIPIWALVVIYLFASYDETRSRAAQLGVGNASLRAVQEDTNELLAEERRRLVEAIQHGITGEIEQLRQLVRLLARPGAEDEIAVLADRVAAYSSDVVRETSHRLRRSDELPSAVARPAEEAPSKGSLFRSYLRAEQPILVPTVLIVSKGASVWLLRWDPRAVVSQFFAFGLMLLLAWTGRALISRFARRPSVGEFVFGTLLILATAAVVMWGFSVTRGVSTDPGLIPLPTIGFYVAGIFFTARLLAAVQLRWRDVSTELESVNVRLASANARLLEELTTTREQLADVLHGPVQGRLAATSMALRLYADDRDAGRPVDLEATVATTLALLDRALVDLSHLGRPTSPRWVTIESGMEHICQMWARLVTITWHIEDRWVRSPVIIDAVVTLSAELVTNASRHADARSVDIAIVGVDDATVSLTAIDDGRGPQTAISTGGGLAAVANYGGSWNISRTAEGVTRVDLLIRDPEALVRQPHL